MACLPNLQKYLIVCSFFQTFYLVVCFKNDLVICDSIVASEGANWTADRNIQVISVKFVSITSSRANFISLDRFPPSSGKTYYP